MAPEPSNYAQGGDAQAIKRIANSYYNGYLNMFEANDWPERGAAMLSSVQRHVAETYGSIADFEKAHQQTDIKPAIQAIFSDPPNVWLTSFYAFYPESWGFLGFADESRRESFIKRSHAGALVVIYGSGKATKENLGKVLGILQMSHQTGDAKEFMSPEAWHAKDQNPEWRHKWNFAVKATRAWTVTSETKMAVRDFAPEATRNEAWQHIGSRGEKLTADEARNILELDLQETQVYGEDVIQASSVAKATQIFSPSRAGPVSQSPYVVKEAEGTKYLYILKLDGNLNAFMVDPVGDQFVIKVGFSKSPQTRCDDYNRTLPSGSAFRWSELISGAMLKQKPLSSSKHARHGEKAIQTAILKGGGSSLGGEFFLADAKTIEAAWHAGNLAAKEFVE